MTIDRKHASEVNAEFRGLRYTFRIYPQNWHGNRIRFYFDDLHFKNSGYVDLQADTGELEINLDKPYKNFASQEDVTAYIMNVCKHFVMKYTFGWSPLEDVSAHYDAAYHERSGYLNPSELEIQVKTFQAETVDRLAKPRKALVAGCSSGLLVRKLRMLSCDAWGFDVMPDIGAHTLPGMAPYIRSGSVQRIPFTAEDNFDTFVAIDVLEHIPEKYIPNMVEEWIRLGIQKLALMINLNQSNFEGHVTLRPPSWWQAQWQEHFVIKEFFQRPQETLYPNDNDENHCITYWERIVS
jgi:hypothetical protein